MQFSKISTDPETTQRARRLESLANTAVRAVDQLKAKLRIGGRRAPYDDLSYEFVGGAAETLRKKHYDKSLRLLWKAEQHAPYLGFRDANPQELQLRAMAVEHLSAAESVAFEKMGAPDFKAMLNREYTTREKQAIVAVLSIVVHGEAYAWLVSSDLLSEVKSTGARAALTMQVFEEAKHFIVLRELLRAFDVPMPRLLAPEYVILEAVVKARGLEKLYGMNVVVETLALAIIGMLSHLPGLEVLRLFHLDESRHTALPSNYFREFPLSVSEQRSPFLKVWRLIILLPALLLIPLLEQDLAELGVDACDFVGASARKVVRLAIRNGFELPLAEATLLQLIDTVLNFYCSATRSSHTPRRFTVQETTRGDVELDNEAKIFRPSPPGALA